MMGIIHSISGMAVTAQSGISARTSAGEMVGIAKKFSFSFQQVLEILGYYLFLNWRLRFHIMLWPYIVIFNYFVIYKKTNKKTTEDVFEASKCINM